MQIVRLHICICLTLPNSIHFSSLLVATLHSFIMDYGTPRHGPLRLPLSLSPSLSLRTYSSTFLFQNPPSFLSLVKHHSRKRKKKRRKSHKTERKYFSQLSSHSTQPSHIPRSTIHLRTKNTKLFIIHTTQSPVLVVSPVQEYYRGCHPYISRASSP